MNVIAALDCFLCERPRLEGVRIGPVWCCAECEGRIVRTEVGTDDYEEIVSGMRRFWQTYGRQLVP